MNRRLALIAGLSVLFGARVAAAQEVTIGYQGLPYKSQAEPKTGINLAEGVLMHVGAGAEAGWDSNVFYTSPNSGTPIASSGILRFTGYGEITNSPRAGSVPTGLVYDLRAGLTYRRYTSSENGVGAYANAFMPSAGLSLGSSSGPWSFQLIDTFLRLEDPPYQGAGGGPIARDNNLASAQVQWSPGGGRITTTLRYNNIVDIFEKDSGFSYGNNLTNQLVLDVSWRWLPKTAVFGQVSQGWVTYLSTQTNGKVDSYPLHVFLGLRGLITQKTTLLLSLGYGNAFYSSGVSTGGVLGSTFIDAQLIILPTMLSRVVVGYHQDFSNSIISNFFYENAVYASYVQQILGRFAFDLSSRASYHRYEGLLPPANTGPQRTETIVMLGATLDYFMRSWAYLGVGYGLITNISDYELPGTFNPITMMPNPPQPVDYLKQQVFARLGLTY